LYEALFHHADRDERKSAGIGFEAGGGGVACRVGSRLARCGDPARVVGSDEVAVAVAAMMAESARRGTARRVVRGGREVMVLLRAVAIREWGWVWGGAEGAARSILLKKKVDDTKMRGCDELWII